MEKKKYYYAVGGIILFVVFQVAFVIMHGVISINALSYYKNTPSSIDKAAKLIVQPNYLLADIYLNLPTDINSQYSSDVNTALGAPSDNLP